ncbi:RHS repeat-associated core domain-containing protein [Streptomyces bacillaris]|uniref:RHS repeat domain-containing protein n=1 Tax=Streptomyces bacillaris TaxID=68179 RepID=UPI00335F775D
MCYTYDHLRRLTEAWTAKTATCAAEPAAVDIGGPAPYWHSYTYDKAGNRLSEVRHDTGGNSAEDVKRTYAYTPPGTVAANQLTGVTTTKGADTSTAPYGYDEAGNTTTRPGQKLTWDAEGQVATVTEGSSTTSYLYDADGNRLITRSPSKTTLHLGHTEITLDKGATTAKATRYMALGGGNQAIRNNDGTFAFTLGDHQGTAGISVKADDLALSQRRNLPFGGNRGADSGTWPGTKGFVGGIDETGTTGLVHLGAREYDPAIGRFISVDPVLDVTDSQQMNGYNYANNSPVTLSDPDGLRPIGPTDSPRGDEEYARKNHGSQWINNGYGWYWKNVQQTKIQGHGTITTTYIGRSTRNHPAPRSSVAFTPIKPKPKVTSRPYMGAGMFGPPRHLHTAPTRDLAEDRSGHRHRRVRRRRPGARGCRSRAHDRSGLPRQPSWLRDNRCRNRNRRSRRGRGLQRRPEYCTEGQVLHSSDRSQSTHQTGWRRDKLSGMRDFCRPVDGLRSQVCCATQHWKRECFGH